MPADSSRAVRAACRGRPGNRACSRTWVTLSPACLNGDPHHIPSVRNSQLVIWYVSNERVMPNRDRRIFGLPCRFPARPTIFAVGGRQAYDRTGFFSIGGATKKILPGFSLCGREGRGRVARPAQRGVVALGMPVLIISPPSTL